MASAQPSSEKPKEQPVAKAQDEKAPERTISTVATPAIREPTTTAPVQEKPSQPQGKPTSPRHIIGASFMRTLLAPQLQIGNLAELAKKRAETKNQFVAATNKPETRLSSSSTSFQQISWPVIVRTPIQSNIRTVSEEFSTAAQTVVSVVAEPNQAQAITEPTTQQNTAHSELTITSAAPDTRTSLFSKEIKTAEAVAAATPNNDEVKNNTQSAATISFPYRPITETASREEFKPHTSALNGEETLVTDLLIKQATEPVTQNQSVEQRLKQSKREETPEEAPSPARSETTVIHETEVCEDDQTGILRITAENVTTFKDGTVRITIPNKESLLMVIIERTPEDVLNILPLIKASNDNTIELPHDVVEKYFRRLNDGSLETTLCVCRTVSRTDPTHPQTVEIYKQMKTVSGHMEPTLIPSMYALSTKRTITTFKSD